MKNKHSSPSIAMWPTRNSLGTQAMERLPVVHYNQGCKHFDKQEWSQALTHYKLAIGYQADFPQAYYNMCLIHEELGNLSEAFQCAQRAKKLYSQKRMSSPTDLNHIIEEIESDLVAELSKSESFTSSTCSSSRSALYLSSTDGHPERKNPAKALMEVKSSPALAGTLSPSPSVASSGPFISSTGSPFPDATSRCTSTDTRSALTAMAKLSINQDDFAQAIDKQGSDISTLLLERGDEYAQHYKFEEAIVDYTKVIGQRNQNCTSGYYRRAFSYAALGMHKEAIADYTKVIEHNNNPIVYYNRGCSYERLGKFDKAITDFTQAIILGEDDEAFSNRIRLLQKQRYYLAAIVDYRILRHKEPLNILQTQENIIFVIQKIEQLLLDYKRVQNELKSNLSKSYLPALSRTRLQLKQALDKAFQPLGSITQLDLSLGLSPDSHCSSPVIDQPHEIAWLIRVKKAIDKIKKLCTELNLTTPGLDELVSNIDSDLRSALSAAKANISSSASQSSSSRYSSAKPLSQSQTAALFSNSSTFSDSVIVRNLGMNPK